MDPGQPIWIGMRDVTIILIVYLPRPIRHWVPSRTRYVLVNVRCSRSGRLSLNIPLCEDADRRLDARGCTLGYGLCACAYECAACSPAVGCSTVNIDGRMQK